MLALLPCGNCTVVWGTAGNEHQASAAFNLRNVVLDSSQDDSLRCKVDTTPHSIDDWLGLLENFLLHEETVIACKRFE